ncbi:MAG: HAMP domain-containing histidine kinase [Gemmatimonadetes bacterium]|nr:HAMP domain-containing histidine kinase [Gemmatimonadota bacterium]
MNKPSGARIRPGWPLLLLVASLIATVMAAVQAWSLARSNRETAARVLEDYASIATWNYSRFVSAALEEAVVSVLSPVMHYQMHEQLHRGSPPHPRWFVDHYLEMSSARYGDTGIPAYLPRTYVGFVLGSDTLGVAGEALPPDRLRGIVDTVTRRLRTVYEAPWAWELIVRRIAEQTQVIAYTIMPMAAPGTESVPGDTAVYAFIAEPTLWQSLFDQTYAEAPILPRALTGTRGNPEVLAVSLHYAGGRDIFRSHESFRGQTVEVPLAPKFGGLYVSAAVLPEMAESLIIGGLPKSRMPYLLGLLVLAAGLTLVAVRQLRREHELVQLRADFVSNVSHELRTPLAQIRLFLDTVRLGRARTPEQLDWSLSNIERETARLDGLVERILTFSRTGRDDVPLRKQRIDIAATLAEAVSSFRPLAAPRGTAIVLDADTGAIVHADAEALRQVVLNLLDNAVKYGPAGQTVRVTVTKMPDAIRLVVMDEGPGVPLEERSDIFRPFRRGRTSAASGTGGGGIGLAIVWRVVQRHGGRVFVEDAPPGRGAAFVVELPHAEPQSASEPRPALGTTPG